MVVLTLCAEKVGKSFSLGLARLAMQGHIEWTGRIDLAAGEGRAQKHGRDIMRPVGRSLRGRRRNARRRADGELLRQIKAWSLMGEKAVMSSLEKRALSAKVPKVLVTQKETRGMQAVRRGHPSIHVG